MANSCMFNFKDERKAFDIEDEPRFPVWYPTEKLFKSREKKNNHKKCVDIYLTYSQYIYFRRIDCKR